MSGKSLSALYLKATELLGSRFEAAQLLFHATNTNENELRLRGGQLITEHGEAMLFSLCSRRLGGEPLQYLLGEWEFYSLPFRVGPGVLIPRADTEILVDTALELIRDKQRPEIIDLCSGSGCIAIALAKHLPQAVVTAVELSDQAFVYLSGNIALNNSAVRAIHTNALEYTHEKKLDLVASNPPYIPTNDIDGLQDEVLHEPRLALDGGNDGLDFYREIATKYYSQLAPGGWFCLEVGFDQAAQVQQLLREQGCSSTATRRDLSGIERVVIAQKPCADI